MAAPTVVLHYLTPEGRCPFREWIDSLGDAAAKHAVLARINRIRAGTFGDWKSVGGGVYELRVDLGPGYRVYFGRGGKTVVVLLTAGDKRSQDADITRARRYWRDYEARTKRSTGGRRA